jgi:mono/diheme cytochrome c family protein
VELIRTSRIGLPGWTAEMTKMRNWGALVDETKAAPFAGWFAQRYPVAEREPPAVVISASAAIAAVAPEREKQPLRGDPKAGAALYAKDCTSCHGPDAEGVGGGPVLIEAPAIYQRQQFAKVVLKGQGRMPASPGTTDAEISNLLAFLRQLH